MLRQFKKAFRVLRNEGSAAVYRGFLQKLDDDRSDIVYQEWISRYDSPDKVGPTWVADDMTRLSQRPLISVLMPVYNVEERWLRRAIDSVLSQTYPVWELCIADDNSSKSHIRMVLEEYRSRDDRIKVVFREKNGHISAASNSALSLANGDFCALLDHDDELAPNALYFVAKEINEFPGTDFVYTDEDKIDAHGKRTSPAFKPDWSPELFCSLNLVTHLSVYRTSLLNEIGGFRVGFEGSQDHDLALRAIERLNSSNIRHIPRILYHWRSIPGSVALDSSEKSYAHDRARMAIQEHYQRTGVSARSVRGYRELHRTIYDLPDPKPTVSVIIVETANARWGNALQAGTDYKDLEIVSAKNNFPALNAAVRMTTGSVICFLDPTSTTKDRQWLTELVSLAIQNDIGAVGPKVKFPNGSIKSAGYILGMSGGLGRPFYSKPSNGRGYFFALQVARNVSALPLDCLVVRRDVFEAAGGFDAVNFSDIYGEVDLCLRLLEQGYRNVWTPWSEIIQDSKIDPPSGTQLDALKAKWPSQFASDRYFNPNLSLETPEVSFAFPPRIPTI